MKLILLLILFVTTEAFASIGKITAINGSATIERNQQTLIAKIGSLIETQDIIITDDNTQLQMIFNDKTVITLGERTKFIIQAYMFNGISDSHAEFSLANGFMKSVTGQIGKLAPNRFKVKTKDVTIGIRGTTFTLETNDRFTQLITLSGATYLRDNETGKIYEVPKGKKLSFNSETKEVEIVETELNSAMLTGNATKTLDEVNQSVLNADETIQTSSINNSLDNNIEKITVNTATYSSYGYWANASNGEMTDVWAEAAPGASTTDPDIILAAINFIGPSPNALYSGNVVAFDDANNKGSGSILVNINFNAVNPVTGNLEYTIAGTHWNTSFAGDVNQNGIDFNSFTPATSDVSNISGEISGQFYGPNAEELAGTFSLSGQDSTSADVNSSGSYNATSAAGIQ
ncbi:FecR domain-containing protein [Thiomicrorhabdus lithotrophica]|uniref:FecR domain-containing protein n=1 Tax=Thiomicrorhabdus lithotrophica TaxID=2949997 RepID=A0ABY8C9W8_9GAMM|nr:FecR domain-containing protein [Thiomicrorhabdus lithotrophica]WEJ62765.1 FecR domain-containing protein [Thiomicrorhabdus lithotrophica]